MFPKDDDDTIPYPTYSDVVLLYQVNDDKVSALADEWLALLSEG